MRPGREVGRVAVFVGPGQGFPGRLKAVRPDHAYGDFWVEEGGGEADEEAGAVAVEDDAVWGGEDLDEGSIELRVLGRTFDRTPCSNGAFDGYPRVREAACVAPEAFVERFGPSLELDGRRAVAELSDPGTGTDEPTVHSPGVSSPSKAAVPFPEGTADHSAERRVGCSVQGCGANGAGSDLNLDAGCRGGTSA